MAVRGLRGALHMRLSARSMLMMKVMLTMVVCFARARQRRRYADTTTRYPDTLETALADRYTANHHPKHTPTGGSRRPSRAKRVLSDENPAVLACAACTTSRPGDGITCHGQATVVLAPRLTSHTDVTDGDLPVRSVQLLSVTTDIVNNCATVTTGVWTQRCSQAVCHQPSRTSRARPSRAPQQRSSATHHDNPACRARRQSFGAPTMPPGPGLVV